MKTYEVIGNAPVHGHEPGSTFTADIEDSFLLSIGALKVVEEIKPEVEEKPVKPKAPFSFDDDAD